MLFNIPELYFFPHLNFLGLRKFHIARTTIAGCTTECGKTLHVGQDWTTAEPPRNRVCKDCAREIEHLPYQRGLKA